VINIITTRKEKSFLLIVLIPLMIFGYAMFSPHITHPDHFTHIAIHEAGLLISGFLLTMTLLAYNKTKLTRMFFSAAAFATLTIAQGTYLFLEQDMSTTIMIDYFSVNEIFDFLIVVMTVLFAAGVFYKNKPSNHN
jgi:hypothetical protein